MKLVGMTTGLHGEIGANEKMYQRSRLIGHYVHFLRACDRLFWLGPGTSENGFDTLSWPIIGSQGIDGQNWCRPTLKMVVGERVFPAPDYI